MQSPRNETDISCAWERGVLDSPPAAGKTAIPGAVAGSLLRQGFGAGSRANLRGTESRRREARGTRMAPFNVARVPDTGHDARDAGQVHPAALQLVGVTHQVTPDGLGRHPV